MTEMVASGLRYCTAHHGVVECDEDGPCDWGDPKDHPCAVCGGSGETEDGDEFCDTCGGDGVTPCALTPLLYAPASIKEDSNE